MSARPRIGVVGVGTLGARHARVLGELGREAEAPLVYAGAHDLDPARAESVCREHGGTAYPSLAALLDDVDGVIVAAPTVRHAELAHAALARGRDALVEKPLADTSATPSASTRACARRCPRSARRASSRRAGCPCSRRGRPTSTSCSIS
jgi:predicted dehydrogenase